jgi:hypothetical protein
MKKAGRSSAETAAFNRRLLRSMPTDAFNRRLLRSSHDAFSRRLLKRSGKHDPFARRLLRSASPTSAFYRRLLRSEPSYSWGGNSHQLQQRGGADAFKRRILKKSVAATAQEPKAVAGAAVVEKRQSLIPFPRTGKRSDPEVALPVLQDMDTSLQEEGLEPLEEDDLVLDILDYPDNEEADGNDD